MKAVKKFWKSTPSEYKDYLFIYLWGVIWTALNLVQPRVVGQESQPLADLGVLTGRFWAAIALVGGILALIGLVRRDNLVLERAGVSLLMVGPIAYGATLLGELIYRAVSGEIPVISSDWRILVTMVFAMWPFLFLNKRRRHLRNRVHLVSKIPLNEENEKK